MLARYAKLTAGFGIAMTLGCTDVQPDSRIAAPSLTPGSGRPHTVVVEPVVDPTLPRTALQQGVDRVAEGGTVFMKPGVYDEQVVINKGLTLRPIPGAEEPVIVEQRRTVSAAGTDAVIKVETPTLVMLRDFTVHHDNIRGVNVLFTEANVVVDGMSFEGATTTLPVTGNGVTALYLSGDTDKRARIAVLRSRFTVGGLGISIGGDVDGVVAFNHVRNNVSRLPCVGVSPVGHGRTRQQSPGNETNVVIFGNLFEDCGTSQAGRFNSVVIAGAPGAATTGTVNVIGNTIRTNGAIAGGLAPCPASAILYEHYSGVIERNTIVNVIDDCAHPDPLRNFPSAIFVGSRVAGIRAANVKVRFNDIAGNAIAGLRIGGNQPDAIDASCNWWGHASGPSGIGSGSGDAIVVEAGGAAPTFAPFATGPVARSLGTTCSGGTP